MDAFHRPGYYRDREFAYGSSHQNRRILYAIWHIQVVKLGSCKMKVPVNSPRRLPDSAMRRIVLTIAGVLLLTSAAIRAESLAWTRAHELYQRTDYAGSLKELLGTKERDAAVELLLGQDYFGLAEYKQATESLEKAVALAPNNAEAFLWLGRAYGRRAETSNPFSAPGYASKARQMFERAVALDPTNREAVGDLFDYYLGAPGFLGGGENKAEALASRVAQHDPAEGHYYQAQLDDRRKQYDSAEKHLRAALELAPRQVGRIIPLARYLSAHGRIKESDALFEQAERIAPGDPGVIYERASAYVKSGRNLDEARKLLHRYLESPITPSDPPKSEAQSLLRKIGA
jgi:tetratricopeptide (TPR) repeat protein